ncbi:MAG: mechanosensitive ion channel domain-containing protein, partial [Planctomycetota bacterium]
MLAPALTNIIASGNGFLNAINYEIIKGNEIWRFALLLLVILVALAAGRIAQYTITGFAKRRQDKTGTTVLTLFLKCLSKPISVAVFALGIYLCKLCLIFEDKTATPVIEGISSTVEKGWARIATAIAAIAVAYGLFRLVDIIEYYLLRWTGKTKTTLDDMLVPVIRKALRITVAIIAAIYIIDNILNQDIQSILLGAGVGGFAIALAAKDTISNFFGSVTIFADRPFQMNELIKIGDHLGPVEEVG